jgi:NAD(P)-dependent dehydrogenase (short-subunit alcohol dehydrogenase family)
VPASWSRFTRASQGLIFRLKATTGSVPPGATLELRTSPGPKGPQVTEIVSLDASTALQEPPRRPRPERPAYPSGDHATVEQLGSVKWYNASKGWMVTATKSMAVELAPLGVRVNAINPVAGETPLLKTFMGEDTPEMRAKFLSTIPIGRFSTPEDMGNAACFLCSDEASYINGEAIVVDGGQLTGFWYYADDEPPVPPFEASPDRR